jgi:intein/homing endonuclease
MELRHDVNSTILRLNELSEGLKRFGRASGLSDHGLYVRFFKPEDVKEKLKEYIRELEGEIDRAKRVLATVRLLS